jgi:ligand-binding sensor domain-containing protein
MAEVNEKMSSRKRVKNIIMVAGLIWVLSIVSCFTFAPPNQGKIKQAQREEAIGEKDTGQGEILRTKGEIRNEKILLSNKVRCVAADDKNVWVATDRGVSRYIRKEGAWIHYTKSDGLVSDDVLALAIDGDWVWVATRDGISRYDASSGHFKTFKKKDGLASDIIQCIAVDGNYVWFGTDSGLNRYDKQIDSWALRSKNDGLSANNVRTIAVEDEYVWVGTQPDKEQGGGNDFQGGPREKGKPGAGVNRYHRRTDSWNTYSKTDGLADDKLSTIAVGEDEVWFGTRNDGVSLYSKTDQAFVKSYTKTDVLNSNKIESIAVDGSQIWFGTANAGAQRYLRTVNTWLQYTTKDGLASNHVTWITVHGNEIWFATYESGLSKYNKVKNQWTTYTKADSLSDDDLRVVKADSRDNIWIGTALGISVYNPKSNEWINYQRKDGLITDYIMDIEIEDGDVWIATDRGVGLLDEETKIWRFYNHRDGLSSDFVTSLTCTGKDMWAGTQGGLFKFRPDEKKWVDVGADSGFSGQLITALVFDGKLYLWVGTEDGIWRYEPTTGKAVHYGTNEGLANNCINAISIADDGLVYAGTQRGLFVYKNGKWETVTLGGSEGQPLPGEDIRALAPDDKILWIGTMSGLVRYDREQNQSQVVNIGEESHQYSVRAICIKDDLLWLATASGLLQVSRANGSLKEECRAMPVKEPFREPGVSNIEFDGNYVWFSNWSASTNGAIVRYDRKSKTWRRFTRENIFRNKEVRTPTEIRRILVTDKYVWFATNYGVLRYDKGLDAWKHYTMKDGLALDNLGIIVESNRSIWAAATEDTMVSRYDKESEKWESIDIPCDPRRQNDWFQLLSIEADGKDVWFGFWSEFCGLRRYDEETKEWHFYTRKDGMTKSTVRWLAIDADRVWASHGWQGDVSYYDKKTKQWNTVPHGQIQGSTQRIIVSSKSVWVITVDGPNSIARYDKANDGWTTLKPKGGFMGDTADVIEDGDYVWLATFNNGINRFHMASGTWTNFNDRTGLLQNHINERALKVDDRFVWAGTSRGLSIYDKESETWTSYTQSETLIGNEVRAVVADERYVWCGTSQGLSRYDKLYGTWTSFRKKGGRQFMSFGWMSWDWWEPEDEDSLVSNDINSLAVDDRYLWVGTKEGASRYDKIADRWDRYTRETGLPNPDVATVVVDGYDVWAGTGAGLCKYPRMSDDPNAWVTYTSGVEIKPMVVSQEYAKSLVSDEIWSLAADGKYVWVGTRIGVSRYDKGRDTWVTFTKEDGLASDAVSSIAVEDSRIWFGSDNGVSMYDKNSHDWTILTTIDGLSSDRITCIASDGDNIWLGTFDTGVTKYNIKTKQWEIYTKKDGLAHNSILSIAVDRNLVWFGTSRGLSRYDKTTGDWTTFTQVYGPEDI